jgi:hypothetical protein
MKRAIGRGLTVLALLVIAAAFGYSFYAQMTSPPWKDLGLPAAAVAFIVASLAGYFALKDYHGEGAPDVRLQVRPPAPKPLPSSAATAFMSVGLVLMVLFGIYWRHTFHASERTLSVDTWWPIILPVATGLTAMGWLIDTVFRRIIMGSHSGRPQAALRLALVTKRLAVAALVFAIAGWFGVSHLAHAQEAYRSVPAQIWLACVPALIISLIVIRR